MLLVRLVLLTILFVAAVANSSPHKPQLESPTRVTILVDDSYPPYTYQANGELYGIYVDIVRQAARLLEPDYAITLQAVPWKRGLSSLESGEAFALIPPYIHIKKRPFIWPYSVALQEEVVVAFCNQGVSLKSLPHIKPERSYNIGINAGYMILDEELMQSQKLGYIKIWENKSTRSNIEKLAMARIDCYVNDRLSTFLGINKLAHIAPDLDTSRFVEDKVLMRRTAHIGYLKGYDDRYPFKHDFIKKMDKALQQVIDRQEDSNHNQ